MSTQRSFADLLSCVQKEGIEMEPDPSSLESRIAWCAEDGAWGSNRGRFTDIVDGLDLASVRNAVIPLKTIGRVNPETVSMTVTWSADVDKFRDISRLSHELGLISINAFAGKFSAFRDVFGEMGDREACPIVISVPSEGRRIDIPV